jgi:hypothetical protein
MRKLSALWKLNLSDFWKAFVITVISQPVAIIYNTVQAGSLTFDWHSMGKAALMSAIIYLGNNWITGMNGRLFSNAPFPASAPK